MARGALLLLVSLFVGAPAAAKEEIRLPSPSTAHKGSFEPEAYRVKWYLRPPSPRRSSVKPEAKWDPPASAGAGEPARGIHVEPGMLFLRKSLFPGAILPEGTRLAGHGFPAPRRFISRAAADAVPFSSDQLDTILRMFRIPRGSSKADQVAATLRTCEEASPEPHACATSQQAAAAFAASALGTGEPRAVVTVVHGEEEAAGARYAVAPTGSGAPPRWSATLGRLPVFCLASRRPRATRASGGRGHWPPAPCSPGATRRRRPRRPGFSGEGPALHRRARTWRISSCARPAGCAPPPTTGT